MAVNYYEFINIAISFSILMMVVLLLILSGRKFRKPPASYWALVIFHLLAYYFLTLFNRYGWFDNIPILKGIQNLVPVAFGPFLFLLFAHYLNRGIKTGLHLWKNFIVLFIFTLGLLPYLFFLPNPGNETISQYSRVYIFFDNEVGAIGFLVVSIWSFTKLQRIKKNKQEGLETSIKYKGIQYKFIRILSYLILSHGIIWILDINFTILGLKLGYFLNQINLIYFLIVGYIFVFLFLTYPAAIYEVSLENEILEKEKYQFSNLPKEKAKEYLQLMNQHMLIKKPYLDDDLTLQQLSEQLDMPHTVLSEIMNNLLKQNFYDYVNNFRVEEFKRLASDQHNQHLKILSLAFDSGFKSKTTFNTAFKKFTGQTPSEYMKRNN